MIHSLHSAARGARVVLGTLLLSFLIPLPAHADEFLRVRKGAAGEPVAMETAIVTYSLPRTPGATVDLIAAVHVGEADYYRELNRRFATYDAVLYELIAEEGQAVPAAGERPGNFVSAMQTGIKSILGLEFQLDIIDYSKPNLVHADLSPEGFMKSLKDRGETIWTLVLRLLLQSMNEDVTPETQLDQLKVLAALLQGDPMTQRYTFRRFLAQNFGQLDAVVTKLEGPNGSTIIGDRNQKVLEVLEKELRGKKKRFAIFFGGAHMPDMQRRLEKRFGARRKKEDWIVAWGLRAPSPSAPSAEGDGD